MKTLSNYSNHLSRTPRERSTLSACRRKDSPPPDDQVL